MHPTVGLHYYLSKASRFNCHKTDPAPATLITAPVSYSTVAVTKSCSAAFPHKFVQDAGEQFHNVEMAIDIVPVYNLLGRTTYRRIREYW